MATYAQWRVLPCGELCYVLWYTISLQTMQETVHRIDDKRLRKQMCADSSMKFSRSCSACHLSLCEIMVRIAWSNGHFAVHVVHEEWTGGTPNCLSRNRNVQSHSSYLILVYGVYRLWGPHRKDVPRAAKWVPRTIWKRHLFSFFRKKKRKKRGCKVNM